MLMTLKSTWKRWGNLVLILLSLALAQAEEKMGWFERLVKGPAWAYAAALTLGLTFEPTTAREAAVENAAAASAP